MRPVVLCHGRVHKHQALHVIWSDQLSCQWWYMLPSAAQSGCVWEVNGQALLQRTKWVSLHHEFLLVESSWHRQKNFLTGPAPTPSPSNRTLGGTLKFFRGSLYKPKISFLSSSFPSILLTKKCSLGLSLCMLLL